MLRTTWILPSCKPEEHHAEYQTKIDFRVTLDLPQVYFQTTPNE